MKQSAVSYIERKDGRLLCVWNRRYGGWSFPGGLVEEGGTLEVAQARELREETSLVTVKREPMFDGPHKTGQVVPEESRGLRVGGTAP